MFADLGGGFRDLLTFGPEANATGFHFFRGRSVHTPALDKKRLYKQ